MFIHFMSLSCETFSTVESRSLKATAVQISIFFTLIVWLSCWDRVMRCFIWHTSCYVMSSIAAIISLRLVKPAVRSYLHFMLPPNQGLNLLCEKGKVTWLFWKFFKRFQFIWGCWFSQRKNNLLRFLSSKKKHVWLDRSWKRVLSFPRKTAER